MRTHIPVREAIRDLWQEVFADIAVRKSRATLTALGTLVGVAVLVSTLGLASSLESQLTMTFQALVSREVTVKPNQTGPDRGSVALPQTATERALSLRGVLEASTVTELPRVKARGISGADTPGLSTVIVVAVSDRIAETLEAKVSGPGFGLWRDQEDADVVLVGGVAADVLGVRDGAGSEAVLVNGLPVTVVGILTELQREPLLNQAVLVRKSLARKALGPFEDGKMVVLTDLGAAEVVARQLPFVISPSSAESFTAETLPTPTITRDRVLRDSQILLLILGAVSLLIGGVGIANATLVAVMERVPEIGLRRALGARRSDIIAQFLLFSVVIGTLGAAVGGLLGAVITAIVSTVAGWPPTLDPLVLLSSPFIGALIGLLAGIYPAVRSASVEPISALRTAAS